MGFSDVEYKMRTKTRLRSHRWLVFMMNPYLPQRLRCESALAAAFLAAALELLKRRTLLAAEPAALPVVRHPLEHAI